MIPRQDEQRRCKPIQKGPSRAILRRPSPLCQITAYDSKIDIVSLNRLYQGVYDSRMCNPTEMNVRKMR